MEILFKKRVAGNVPSIIYGKTEVIALEILLLMFRKPYIYIFFEKEKQTQESKWFHHNSIW